MEKERRKPENKRPLRMFRVRRGKAGDGSLDRAGAQGEKDSVDWKDHLIDSESFGADRAGEKDPVEKAEDAGEESGGVRRIVPVISGWGLWDRRHGQLREAEGFCYIYVGAGE